MATDQYKKVGKMSDMKVLNAGEQGMRQDALSGMNGLNDNYSNLVKSMSSDQMKGLLGNIGTAAGGYGAIGQGITNAANMFNNIDTSGYANAAAMYDPMAANNSLLSQMPNYNAAAQSSANQALSGYNQSATDLASLATKDAMRASSAELAAAGLLGSGAATQSMLEAALTPQQKLQTDLAAMQSSYQGNVLNSLMGSGANMLGQGYETQNANRLSAAEQDIQKQYNAAQAGMQGAMSQLDVQNSNVQAQQATYDAYMGQIMSQLQGTQAQGQNLQGLADQTQQQWYTPQYSKKTSALDYLSAGAGILGGIGGMMTGLGGVGAGLGAAGSFLGGLGSFGAGTGAMYNAATSRPGYGQASGNYTPYRKYGQ